MSADTQIAEPFAATQFSVDLDGMENIKATFVGGLEMHTESLRYQEGSMQLPATRKGRTFFNDLTICRKFNGNKDLLLWFKDCQKGKLNKKNGSVIIKDDEGNEVIRFNFAGAWPTSWMGPNFSARAGNVLAEETVVLSVEDLEIDG